MRRLVFLPLLASVAAVVIPLGPAANAYSAVQVLANPRVGHFQPVRGGGYLAWQQVTRKHPNHFDVWARPVSAGRSFRVNAPHTQGANGAIDANVLVYQQFTTSRSAITLFNLRTHKRTPAPR